LADNIRSISQFEARFKQRAFLCQNTVMKNSSITLSKLYFSLSNQGNLKDIKKLFHPEATYSSEQTGLYYGVEDIMTMMHHFFNQYQSLHWHIDEMKAKTPLITEIKFSCLAVDHHQVKSERTGVERLLVVDELIRHIEVR